MMELGEFDIFEVCESLAIAWCKRPEDIFKDFTILSDFYKIEMKDDVNERR